MQVFKPIKTIIIEAACKYWEVEPSYFENKTGERLVVYRKSVVYYLIKQNTEDSLRCIAQLFGFTSHQPVKRLIDNLESTKEVYAEHKRDIMNIQKMVVELMKDYPKEAEFLKPKKERRVKNTHPLARFQTSIF